MDNIEKKLDALIGALGFDVERINVNPRKNDRFPSDPIYDYKLTKRKDPLDVLYDGVPLRQLTYNIIDLSVKPFLDKKYKWIKYPKVQFDAVIESFGDDATKINDDSYLIFGIEVSLDEKT